MYEKCLPNKFFIKKNQPCRLKNAKSKHAVHLFLDEQTTYECF